MKPRALDIGRAPGQIARYGARTSVSRRTDMSELVATIAPAQSVVVPDDLPLSFVDVAYTRTIAESPGEELSDLPNEVTDTVRVVLDSQLHATFALIDVKPRTTLEVRFLAGNGSVKLAKSVRIGDLTAIAITLDEIEIGALATAT